MNLNKSERHGLYTIGHNARFGWSAVTGGEFTRRAAMRLVERGLAMSAGLVTLVDGDGCIKYPEREREGFMFTPFGALLEAKMDADEEAVWRARLAAEEDAAEVMTA